MWESSSAVDVVDRGFFSFFSSGGHRFLFYFAEQNVGTMLVQ